MRYDFLLDRDCLGYDSRHDVRRLSPKALCDDARGLSGTEVTALGLAKALSYEGNDVCIWSYLADRHQPDPGPRFAQLGEEEPEGADVVVGFHDTTRLSGWPARLRVAWHQTLKPPHYERMRTEAVHLYISSTRRNAEHLAQYTRPGVPWVVVPNAWDYGWFPVPKPVAGRLFWHTAPERGLHLLLEVLPAVRRRVPEAHLDIWCRLECAQGHHPQSWHAIEKGLEQCAESVTLHPHGGSRNEVLTALSHAALLAYPSSPPIPCEVMPVSVMEACALGIPVVTAPSDGFEEAFGAVLRLCPTPAAEYLEEFTNEVCTMLTSPVWAETWGRRGYTWANWHTFEETCDIFMATVSEALWCQEKGTRMSQLSDVYTPPQPPDPPHTAPPSSVQPSSVEHLAQLVSRLAERMDPDDPVVQQVRSDLRILSGEPEPEAQPEVEEPQEEEPEATEPESEEEEGSEPGTEETVA